MCALEHRTRIGWGDSRVAIPCTPCFRDKCVSYPHRRVSAVDGTSREALLRSAREPTVRRSVLFLQGPISNFFDRLGRALIARGHSVHRINLHLGDQLFWRLPAVNFRGHFDEWRGFVGAFLDRHAVTELVVHGDRRPHHLIAAEEARARGIAVIATDLGYLRPDWITVEYDGMSSYSRFPRDPAAIRELAERLPPIERMPRFRPVSIASTAVLASPQTTNSSFESIKRARPLRKTG